MTIGILNNQSNFEVFTPHLTYAGRTDYGLNVGSNGFEGSFAITDNATSDQKAISANYKGNSGGIYFGSTSVSQNTEILNSNHQKQYVNPLRQNQDNDDVRLYIGNSIVANTESGGVLANNDKVSYNNNVGIGYGSRLGGGLIVNRSSTIGDQLEFSKHNIGMGIGVGSRGVGPNAEYVYERMGARTSDRGRGAAFGVRFGVLSGVEVVADYSFISNGTKYTIPIGSFLSNLATGNIVGFIQNFHRMIVGEKLPIPQHEVIYPDDKPQRTPQIQMFEVGTNQLTPAGVNSLISVVNNFRNNPDAKIELGSYEDDTSWIKRLFSSSINRERMSNERAEIIKQALISMGVPEDKVSIGHNKVNADDVKMTVEDHNTNIRFITDGKLALNNGASFNSTRSSPAGEALFDKLKNSEEFKALTNGKNKFEIECAANLIFDKVYLAKPAISTEQAISDIQKFYEQGKTLSQAFELMDDKQAVALLSKNKEFLEFVKNNNLNEKEAELLAGYVLKVTDFGNSKFGEDHKNNNGRVSQTLSEALNQYQDVVLNKGLSLREIDTVQEKFNQLLEKNPIYQNIVSNPNLPKDERTLLSSLLFSNYMEGQEKDMATVINQKMEQANRTIYQKGESLSYQAYAANPNDKNNGYYQMRNDQVYNGIKNNAEIAKLFDSDIFKSNIERLHNANSNESVRKLTSREQQIFKTQIQDMMLKNPTMSIEQATNHIVENTYQKGITLSERQNNDISNLIAQNSHKPLPTLENTQTTANQEVVNVTANANNIENAQKEIAQKSNVENIINTQSIINEQAKLKLQQQKDEMVAKNNTVSLF